MTMSPSTRTGTAPGGENSAILARLAKRCGLRMSTTTSSNGMLASLRASHARNAQLDAFLVKRVVVPIVGRQVDHERPQAEAAEAALAHPTLDILDGVGAAKRSVKDAIERLRRELRETAAQHRSAEAETDDAFNPHWGPLFREGYEISKFGEQVEAYACVYTSRVSNFRFYSPMQYFRGPRDRMPHER